MKSIITWCFLGLAFSSAIAWADGELDTRFGTNGAVKISFATSSLGYLDDVAVVDGYIEAAGFERVDGSHLCQKPFPDLFVVQLSLDGTVIGAAHSYPQQTVACPGGLVVDTASGDIYMAGSTCLATGCMAIVARFSASGSLIATNTDPAPSHYYSTHCLSTKPLLDSQERLVAACVRTGEFGFVELTMRRYSTDAHQLTGGAFGPWGLYRVGSSSQYAIRAGRAVAQDAGSGAYYVVGIACGPGDTNACFFGESAGALKSQYVLRLGSAGELDTSFGDGGVVVPLTAPDGWAWGVTVDDSGNVLLSGEYGGARSYAGTGLGYLARITPSGTPDRTFGSGGVVQGLGSAVIDVQADHSNRVYALCARSGLVRLNYRGQQDLSFVAGSQVEALNGPGSAWESMRFTDSTRSSLYLLGGAAGCAGCATAATTAVIAKVMLASGASGPAATTTALNSTATTIMSGQSVTFTATVAGSNPTGTVTFKDGSTVLATENLTSASTSYSTSALTVGNHNITAEYLGDEHNAGSSSQVVTETVNASSSGGVGGGSVGGGSVGGGSVGGGSVGGGGGAFAGLELCGMLWLWLWRTCVARHLEFY